MKTSRASTLSIFQYFGIWLAAFALLLPVSCFGEDMMIFPVPSQSGKDLTKPDQRLEFYSQVGKGAYMPLKIKDYSENREKSFRTSFEECAPGRNAAANEWSAFGVIGKQDINAMGREMWVRYPAFELMFRMYKEGKEIKPDSLDSFRLGLVNNRLPAIWGGWQDEGLLYKVSVMTVPGGENGNYDLYKLEIQNPTKEAKASHLAVTVDGSPDLRLEDGVVRGLGDAAFVIADKPEGTDFILRDWGHCDKRAKRYKRYAKKGLEDPVRTYRLGLDGLPVVYRFKAPAGKKYLVYLVTPLRIHGHYIGEPKEIGDQISEYQVEGCALQRIDYIEHIRQNEALKDTERPLYVRMDGAQDKDGDGYIEVRSDVAAESRLRHTALGMIYVFEEGTVVEDVKKVYGGEMNEQCVWHIDVGVTPEVDWNNQYYDASDIGIARLKLNYTATVAPGEIRTYWLKVPPIYRREPVAMEWIGHAFREILPGEAIPPFGKEKVDALKKADPKSAEKQTVEYWSEYFSKAAQFVLPDPVLNDMFLSRLATRAILDVKVGDHGSYNACSPFFYFDSSYRDHCYSVLARNMAGMTEEAKQLANLYCFDAGDMKEKGFIWFKGDPLELGMREDGYWLTRPGQHDTPGQNLWGIAEHYKMTGDREWLQKKAYPYLKRGAMWIVNSRHKVMEKVGDREDPRYGLIEPGAMEVHDFEDGQGVHMYYMDAFAVLGLKGAAEAAKVLGRNEDAELFRKEYLDLRECLNRSFRKTFKRTGLYEGALWFGAESEGEGAGMYGEWAHNALAWPCRAIDPHDPMWTGTLRDLEFKAQKEGGGVPPGWPYIGVDRAISSLLFGEREKTLDFFCAYTDLAGGTLGWGEGYTDSPNLSWGDQPHNWADVYWLILFRNLFVFEDEDTLQLTPALFRRWHQGGQEISAKGLPTYFGVLDLEIHPNGDGSRIDYSVKITPRGDQAERPLKRIVLFPRTVTGNAIESVQLDGKPLESFSRDTVILSQPVRGQGMDIRVNIAKP